MASHDAWPVQPLRALVIDWDPELRAACRIAIEWAGAVTLAECPPPSASAITAALAPDVLVVGPSAAPGDVVALLESVRRAAAQPVAAVIIRPAMETAQSWPNPLDYVIFMAADPGPGDAESLGADQSSTNPFRTA